jgi:8-oxo-dGTP pyrophosphatase MutT (NUDIX family)
MPSQSVPADWHMSSAVPFFAAAAIVHAGQLVLTLNTDHLPASMPKPCFRLGGVGGAQEPGEHPWECAAREALEEVGAEVHPVAPPSSFICDQSGYRFSPSRPLQIVGEPAPLLITRQPSPDPARSFKSGVPGGPHLYVFTFAAVCSSLTVSGTDWDVVGALLIPPHLLPALPNGPQLVELLSGGATLIGAETPPLSAMLWLHPADSFVVLLDLLASSTELRTWFFSRSGSAR